MYNGLKFNMPEQPSYVDAFSGYSMPNYDVSSAPSYAPKMNGLVPTTSLTPNLNFGPGAQPGSGSGGFLGSLNNWLKSSGVLGTTDSSGMKTDGWGGLALGTVSGLMNAYMGMQQYGLAKKTLAHNKDQFAKNYAAQKQTTNAAFEDRQRARVASNAGAYESVGDYMKKNAIA